LIHGVRGHFSFLFFYLGLILQSYFGLLLHLHLVHVVLPTVLAVLIVALLLFLLLRSKDPPGIVNHLDLAAHSRDLLLAFYVVVIDAAEVAIGLRCRLGAHMGCLGRVGQASRAAIIVGITLEVV
jgi:hypothetical protein